MLEAFRLLRLIDPQSSSENGRSKKRWSEAVLRALVARSLAATGTGQDLLAADRDARIRHPFLEPPVQPPRRVPVDEPGSVAAPDGE